MILLVTMDSVCLQTINVMHMMTAVTTVMNRDAHLVTYTIDLVFCSYYNIVLQVAVLMSSGVMVDTMMENVCLTTTNVMDMMTAVITVTKKTATLKV